MPPVESDPPEWSRLFVGPNADVWVHVRCLEELKDLAVKDRAKVIACMEKMYCQMERTDQIPSEKFNRNEGRYGQADRRVQAFKSYQGRVYGVEGSIKGKRTFFAAVAAVKKTEKADKALLERAAERVATVSKFAPGASV